MKLKNLFFVNLLLVLFCFLGEQKALGQEVVILNENFESYYENATLSHLWNGETWWTGSNVGNYFVHVENHSNSGALYLKHRFNKNINPNETKWQPKVFNISEYSSISFQLDASHRSGSTNEIEHGHSGNISYYGHLIVEYRIDDGAWLEFFKINGNENNQTYHSRSIIGKISGKLLEIRVKAESIKNQLVQYTIDDFVLKGIPKSNLLEINVISLIKPSSFVTDNGEVTFKVNGGNAPYTYWLINRASNSTVVSGSCDEDIDVFSNSMSGGDYRIVIRDESGIEVSENVFLYQAPQIISSDSGDISECASSSLSTNEISVTDPHDHCIDFSNTINHLDLIDNTEINTGSNHPKRTIMFWFKTADIYSQQFLYKEGGKINGLAFYIKDSYLVTIQS